MQKYFINENIELNKSFKIESSDQHHIEKVMRNKNGDQIICRLKTYSIFMFN